jgi:hypothetical protein
MPLSANLALLRGTLDVLVLKVLALEPIHGLGIRDLQRVRAAAGVLCHLRCSFLLGQPPRF